MNAAQVEIVGSAATADIAGSFVFGFVLAVLALAAMISWAKR